MVILDEILFFSSSSSVLYASFRTTLLARCEHSINNNISKICRFHNASTVSRHRRGNKSGKNKHTKSLEYMTWYIEAVTNELTIHQIKGRCLMYCCWRYVEIYLRSEHPVGGGRCFARRVACFSALASSTRFFASFSFFFLSPTPSHSWSFCSKTASKRNLTEHRLCTE